MSLVQTRARPSRTHFHKTYCLSDLLDPMEQIRLRVDQIQTLSAQFSLIPEVEFQWTDSSLIYRQAKVRRRDSRSISLESRRTVVQQLAEDLDRLTETGFVHGDINRKNVICDGERFHLVDLEPSLRRIKHGRPTLMYTPPYISLNDLKQDQLSQETDKIGFYFLAMKTLNPDFQLRDVRQLMQRRLSEGINLLPVAENDFVDWSYLQIFNYILNYQLEN